MAESTELDLQKAFTKPGSKQRFRKLAGFDYMTEEAVEAMIDENDGEAFLDGIANGGEPDFEVDWGAIWHGNSGSFSIYHFDGQFFAKSDIEDDMAGPFESASDAAEWRAGIFDMDYSEEYGTAASIHISSSFGDRGRRLISNREAKKIVEILTSHQGAPLDFYLCEAEPGKLFKDPLHGESGKLLAELHAAQKDGNLDCLYAVRQKFEKLTKKNRADDYVLGEESKHFTSAFDSLLMKVPMNAKGKLARFRTEWVRLCQPRRVGKKTLVTVIRIDNPTDLIDDLVPVADSPVA
jgi:hypothetical protein